MNIIISPSPEILGEQAACRAAETLNRVISEKGAARVLFSTGASQFEMFKALVEQKVDWKRVTMFHLDEYCGLPEDHPASFRKYLRERFISQVPVGAFYLVDGNAASIEALNAAVTAAPIDLGMIGVGENGHIAFRVIDSDVFFVRKTTRRAIGDRFCVNRFFRYDHYRIFYDHILFIVNWIIGHSLRSNRCVNRCVLLRRLCYVACH